MIVAHERDHYHELLKHIKGIAFFGTPHKGSMAANWGTIIANIVDKAAFGTGANTSLLKALKERAPELFNISKSFVYRSGIPILTFYEMDFLEHLNFKVNEPLPFVLACTLTLYRWSRKI